MDTYSDSDYENLPDDECIRKEVLTFDGVRHKTSHVNILDVHEKDNVVYVTGMTGDRLVYETAYVVPIGTYEDGSKEKEILMKRIELIVLDNKKFDIDQELKIYENFRDGMYYGLRPQYEETPIKYPSLQKCPELAEDYRKAYEAHRNFSESMVSLRIRLYEERKNVNARMKVAITELQSLLKE